MEEIMTYALFGYICGSILFARVAATLFYQDREYEKSEDGNPGTVNAFRYGGFWCGLITLCGDLLKGFIPVFLFASTHEEEIFFMPGALVLAAPVLGHAFPLFHRFRGGKGIAVSFGCLLGLMPFWRPFAILAGFFLLFSLIVVITPNFQRTLVTFLCSAFTMFLCIRHQSWFFVYDVHRLSASAYEQGTADEDEDRAWSQPISKAGSHFPAFFSMSIFSWINCRVSATEQTSSSSCSESAKSRNASQTEDSQIVSMLNCPFGVI